MGKKYQTPHLCMRGFRVRDSVSSTSSTSQGGGVGYAVDGSNVNELFLYCLFSSFAMP